jgi:hypothetical protein
VETTTTYEQGSEFFGTLLRYPVVKDTFNLVSSNKLGNVAINAVSTMGKMTTAPVVSRFPEISNKVDQFAARNVAYVGEAFPLTKAPTGDLITGVTNPAKQTISSIQSTIDTNVTTPIKSAAALASEPALKIANQVRGQITPIAMGVDRSLEGIVNKYDGLVDSWLPAEESEAEEEKLHPCQTMRVYSVTNRVRKRLTRRIGRQISTTQTYTAGQFRQIQDSNNLLRQATETVASLNAKLNEMLHTARSQDFTLQNLSKSLLHTTDSIAKYVKENTGQFPDYLQDHLNPMVTFFTDVYEGVMKEINKQDVNALQKAKDIVNVTSQHTLPVLQRTLTDLSASIDGYRTTFSDTLASTTESARSYLNTGKPVGVN